MSRRRILVGLTVPPVVIVGCGQLLDLDGDSILGSTKTVDAAIDSQVANGDAAGPRMCNGVVAQPDDPRVGCGALSCEACSVPFARDTKCAGGTCAVATCTAGRADCNGRSDDGCEADLISAETCGNCTTSCPVSAPFCGNDGTAIRCLVACPPGQATCGKSCVDLKGSIEHCGNCETKCAPSNLPNTDPACVDSKCVTSCRAGQEACDPADATKGCGTLKQFYRDSDNDDHGVATDVKKACTAPAGYVAAGDDCNDENGDVHPGQDRFFPTGYAVAGGGFSYDYNCDGKSEEAPGFVHFEQCAPTIPCSGGGYSPRVGGGPDDGAYCGSTTFVSCVGSASATASGSFTPISCSQTASVASAVPCR